MKSCTCLFLVITISITTQSQVKFSRTSILPVDNLPSRGVVMSDLNRDGFMDVVIGNGVLEESNGRNFFYRNEDGKRFIFVDSAFGDNHLWTEGVYTVDIDNDYDLDLLFVTQFDQINPVFENDGEGNFTFRESGELTSDITSSPGACWCDYDIDGDLDVFVFGRDESEGLMYVNDGNGIFKKITGPWTGKSGDGRACAWGDLNGDGRPDLYIVNYVRKENGEFVEKRRNYLYLNGDGNQFTEVLDGEWVTGKQAGYGVSLLDYDYDQDLDIFITNISRNDDNVLFINDGQANFTNLTGSLVDYTVRPSKGHSWGDYDNDGDLDLYVVNGTMNFPEIQNYLFVQGPDGDFQRIYNDPSAIDAEIGAGVANGDVDNDGDLDLVVANWGELTGGYESNVLYQNTSPANRWVKIRLRGNRSNSFGIGSWIRITAIINGSERLQTRFHSRETGYASQNSEVVHFGLGDAPVIEQLEVTWPDGMLQSFEQLEINHTYEITESTGIKVLP